MSDSSREQDVRKDKREAARLIKSAKTDFRHWTERSGSWKIQIVSLCGERNQHPEPKRAGVAAGRGTGQTKGCVASCVPDADLHPGDDYPAEGMHISPSQSDHAEDKARLQHLISKGDDELECLHEGTHALSCHADQGKVRFYRAQIVQSMCNAGDNILPFLRLAPTCNVDVAAFAVPEFDEGSQTLDFNKFRICVFAYLVNCEDQKQAIFIFCSCCEQGAQAWRAVDLHHHEAHLDNVCGELESLSSKCIHAWAILEMCLASDGGIEGSIRALMSMRPGDSCMVLSCASPCFVHLFTMGM